MFKKYNIDTIDNLLIDVEGHEMSILKSIDFNKILISEIKFEFKHLTSTFNYENSLDELIIDGSLQFSTGSSVLLTIEYLLMYEVNLCFIPSQH